MKVWRYENDQGHGPYGGTRSERVKAMGNSRDHNSATHPGPRADFGSFPIFHYYACPDAKALREWFAGFHGTLQASGYHVAVYEVPAWAVEYGASGKQVRYSRTASATRVL